MEDKIYILVVNDDEDFLMSIKNSLEVREFYVTVASSWERAIETSRNNHFDIALLDLNMPGINSEWTLKALKKDHKWMEVIILIEHGSIKPVLKFTKDGAFTYIRKSLNIFELIAAIRNVYHKRVIKKNIFEEKKMNEIYKLSLFESPRGILRKLREFDMNN